ncbi:hypothetical protein WA158_004569 [Blastocystis sp. Blastoise]
MESNVLLDTGKHSNNSCIHSYEEYYHPLQDFGDFQESTKQLLIGKRLNNEMKPVIDVDLSVELSINRGHYDVGANPHEFQYWFKDSDHYNKKNTIEINSSCDYVGCIYEPYLNPLWNVTNIFPKSITEINNQFKAWFTMEYQHFFIYKEDSSLSILTNADVYVFIDSRLVLNIPTVIGEPKLYTADLNTLSLTINKCYSISIFIASRPLSPRFIQIQSHLKSVNEADYSLQLLNSYSHYIALSAGKTRTVFHFLSNQYKPSSILFLTQVYTNMSVFISFTIQHKQVYPPFILGLYDQGPAFLHLGGTTYETDPSSTSVLFEFFSENNPSFLNILLYSKKNVRVLGRVESVNIHGNIDVNIQYFSQYSFLKISVNNVISYINNNFNLYSYISGYKYSVSLYTPPSSIYATLYISSFSLYIPSLSYIYTYVQPTSRTAVAGSSSHVLYIHLIDNTESPFLFLSSFIYTLTVSTNNIHESGTLSHYEETLAEKGIITVHLSGNTVGIYNVSIIINNHYIRFHDNSSLIHIIPNAPYISATRVSFSSSFASFPFAGYSHIIYIHIEDIYLNTYTTLYSSLYAYFTNDNSGILYAFEIPAGTVAIDWVDPSTNKNIIVFPVIFKLTESGLYSLSISYNGLVLHRQYPVSIIPAIISPAQTLCWGSLFDGVIAGRDEFLYVAAKDQFKNVIEDLSIAIEIHVYPNNNITAGKQHSIFTFSCEYSSQEIYYCPVTLHSIGGIQVFILLLNALSSSSSLYTYNNIYITTFDSTVYPSDPVCNTINALYDIFDNEQVPPYYVFSVQYNDFDRYPALTQPSSSELARALIDDDDVSCYMTQDIGRYDCFVPLPLKGVHSISVNCHDSVIYKYSLQRNCYTQNINATMTYSVNEGIYIFHNNHGYFTLDASIILSFIITDIFNITCQSHLPYLSGVITCLTTNESIPIELRYNSISQSYTQSFIPLLLGLYQIDLYNRGESILSEVIHTEIENPSSNYNPDYYVYGNGIYGGNIYRVNTIQIATYSFFIESSDVLFNASNNANISNYIHTHISIIPMKMSSIYSLYILDYIYTPPNGTWIDTLSLSINIHGKKEIHYETQLHFFTSDWCTIPQFESQTLFTNTTPTEVIYQTQDVYTYYSNSNNYFQVLSEQDKITMKLNGSSSPISPQIHQKSFTYIGSGRYLLLILMTPSSSLYITISSLSSPYAYTYIVHTGLSSIDRTSLLFLDDYKNSTFYTDEEIHISFTVYQSITKTCVYDLDLVRSTISSSVFQGSEILFPDIIRKDDKCHTSYLTSPSSSSSSSDYNTLSLYDTMTLTIYLKDNHGNPMNIPVNKLNFTLLRIYNGNHELVLSTALSVAIDRYARYTIRVPPIIDALQSNTGYYISTNLSDPRGNDVDSIDFVYIFQNTVQDSIRFPYLSIGSFITEFLYLNGRKVNSFQTLLHHVNYSLDYFSLYIPNEAKAGNKITVKISYNDPYIYNCFFLTDTLQAIIISPSQTISSLSLFPDDQDKISFIGAFLAGEVGDYYISIYFSTNPLNNRYLPFNVSLSDPSILLSKIQEFTSSILQYNYYNIFFEIADQFNLLLDPLAIIPPIQFIIYSNNKGYDSISYINASSISNSSISLSFTSLNTYTLFLSIPLISDSTIININNNDNNNDNTYSYIYNTHTFTSIHVTPTCPPINQPNNTILCTVNQECVSHDDLCPKSCPHENYLKCPVYMSNLRDYSYVCLPSFSSCSCVDSGLVSCVSSSSIAPYSLQLDICSRQIKECNYIQQCPLDVPHLCWDYTCTTTNENCPSPIMCPPSYYRCPDNIHCALNPQECPPIPLATNICPPELPLLCPDLEHCSNNIYTCPSMIHCPKDKYLCPNLECVTDPATCIMVSPCPSSLHQCFTGECVLNREDCPQLPSCPAGMKLCENRECVPLSYDCTDIYSNMYIYINETIQMETVYRCPSGDVAANPSQCPSQIVCPPKTYKCADHSCVTMNSICPQVIICPDGFIHCPSGGCAISLYFCGTYPTCPTTTTTTNNNNNTITTTSLLLSPNLLCSLSIYTNISIFLCPKHRPVRCPSGNCVKEANLCVSPRLCPKTLPVRCDDGSCVENIDYCIPHHECPSGHVLCNSGTCAPSEYQCPSTIICIPPSLQCYDGSCRKFNETERDILIGYPPDYEPCVTSLLTDHSFGPCTCDDASLVYCGDECLPLSQCPLYDELYYQCVTNKMTIVKDICNQRYINYPCPPASSYNYNYPPHAFAAFCPITSPYLCSDHTCHSSLSDCTLLDTCLYNQVLCPDGTCQSSITSCNTVPMCSTKYPYLCSSGRCVKNPADCSSREVCPVNRPYRCLTNQCVASQTDCPSITQCKSNEVLCSDFVCHTIPNASSNTISLYMYSLPSLYTTFCEDIIGDFCPLGYILCNDATCVPDEALCPKRTCPLYSPILCPDGTCAQQQIECREVCDTPYLCPRWDSLQETYAYVRLCCNGTYESCCYPSSYEYIQFLPSLPRCDSPFVRCPDGSCREQSQCVNADGCDATNPFKCASGKCTNSINNCLTQTLCPAGEYYCATGKCVPSYQYCDSTHVHTGLCPSNKPIECANGECVSNINLCISIVSCNVETPYRCDNNICMSSLDACPAVNTCLSPTFTRVQKGFYESMCVPREYVDYYEAVTICTHDAPFLNDRNTCSPELFQGDYNSQNCPVYLPYLCSDGTCSHSHRNCYNMNNCLPSNPFKCHTGECTTDPSKCIVSYNPSNTKTQSLFQCPDGSFATSFKMCRTQSFCSALFPYKCADGTCVARASDESSPRCPANTMCPSSSPYLCSDGTCSISFSLCPYVSSCSLDDRTCSDLTCVRKEFPCVYTLDVCPVGRPIKCPDGTCVGNGYFCKLSYCLDYSPYPCAFGNCVSKPSLCPSYTCDNNEIQCWDGSCALSYDICPPVPSCPRLTPTRCYDGSCVETPSECNTNIHPTCPEGTQLCASGDCHVTCESFFGCGAGTYMCSNSTCVDLLPYMFTDDFAILSTCGSSCIGGTCARPSRYPSPLPLRFTLTANTLAPLQVLYDRHIYLLSMILPWGFLYHYPSNVLLSVTPLPDSLFSRGYSVHLNNDTSSTLLTVQETLISVALKISMTHVTTNKEILFDEQFRIPIGLYFFLIDNNIPPEHIYHYNPLLTDLNSDLTVERDQFERATEDHLAADQEEILFSLKKQEYHLTRSIVQFKHFKSPS